MFVCKIKLGSVALFPILFVVPERSRNLLKRVQIEAPFSLQVINPAWWMVKAYDSVVSPPRRAPWQLPNLDGMSTPLEPALVGCLPACINPGSCMISANMAMPGFSLQGIANLKCRETNEPQGLPQRSPPHFQNLLASTDLYLKENQSVFPHGLGGNSAPNAFPGSRRFVVFDQSGNDTRLIYSSLYSILPKPTMAATKPIHGGHLHHEGYAAKLDQIKLKVNEKMDENQLVGEESEMHEDTEEINALLYSDEDDYSDDNNDDNDEVTSTGHSPALVRGSYVMKEQVEEITDEVASSDGLNKRQKLLDGGYKKASAPGTDSSEKVEGHPGYGSDAESSYAFGKTQEGEMDSICGSKQFKKDKVRATLKILESLIPGAKGKDPLLVLDVAIDYLKSLKLNAITLG